MVNWEPVKVLGKGSCASVFLAKSTMDPLHYFAVKVARLRNNSSLSWEKKILKHFIGCPEIVQCLGSEVTLNGEITFFTISSWNTLPEEL